VTEDIETVMFRNVDTHSLKNIT